MDGLVTVTILAGQTTSGSGSFEVTGVQVEESAEPIEPEGEEVTDGKGEEHPPNSATSNEPIVDTTVIHTITTSTNLKDSNYRPTMGDGIDLRLDFSLPNQHNYGEGSTLTYPLPEPLKAVSGSGDLIENRDGNIVKYGAFSVSDGEVIITLNDNARAPIEGGGLMGLPIDGFFEIQAKFESSKNDLNQDLTLPNNGEDETVTLNFKPVGGKKVEKSIVSVDNGGKNSQYVEWEVNVNTLMDDLGDKGKTFSDALKGKHTYDPSSLELWQETLGADGKVLTSTNVTASFPPSPALTSTSNAFDLTLTGKFAYKIKYKTIPSDTEEQSEKLENKASFDDASDTKNTTIQYGAPLAKSVQQTGTNGDANWTVKVNENRRTLAAGVKITDTWKTNADAHELVGGINVIPLVLGTDYQLNHTNAGFEIELLKPVSDEFTITYTTKPKDLVTGNISLTNEVVRSDREKDIQIKTATYSQQVLTKSNSNINYQNKTVDWTIVLNTAGYEMKAIVLDDVFKNNNLKIKPGTFKVMVGNNEVELTPKPKDGDEKKGFVLEIPGPTSEKITITYTTDYDVKGATNLDTYTNIGNLSWETGEKSYAVSNVKSTVDINSQQKNKGYKSGVYNYEEKKFEWSVGINYNFDDIFLAVFTDTLSPSQVVDRASIKVYPLDLTGGDDGEIDEKVKLEEGKDYTLTPDPLANTFTIMFKNEINVPYRIVYESKNKADYYAPDNQQDSVKNDAQLNGGIYGKWFKEVPVEHTKKLLTKGVEQENKNGAKFNWTLNLNWGQSTLKNIKITDTIGKDLEGNPNQKIFEDSFEVCEMNFSEINSNPTEGTCHAPGAGLYDVSFEDPTATFVITFNQEINHAYVVKYDSYFLGASGEAVENTATLSYTSNVSDNSSNDIAEFRESFSFSGGASAKKGQLVITKVDADDTNTKLSGAEFELWSAEKDGFLIERVSTDVDGVYTFKNKVGQGDYYLIETKAPDGYNLNESIYKTRQKVEIKNSPATSDYVHKLTVKNKKIQQAFELTKTDMDGNALDGVEFELRKKDAAGTYNVVDAHKSLITKDGGKIYVDDLESGEYQLIETKAKDASYYLDQTPIEFTIVENQMEIKPLTMKNYKQGELIVKKVDATDPNKVLQGAEFTLYDGSTAIATATTGTDGVAKFTNVKYGKYTLKETKAPQGYLLDAASAIVKDGKPIEIEAASTDAGMISNEKILNAFKLVKTDVDSGALLEGAEFDLLFKETSEKYVIAKDIDGKEVTGLSTNKNGEIQVGNLPAGDYRLIETKSPEFYLLDATEYDFKITDKQTTFTDVPVTNTRGQGEIVITKVDATDNSILIDGVEFELSKDGVPVDTQTTVNGIATFTGLPYGIYTLKETKAHVDYLLDGTEQTIVLGLDTQVNGAVETKTIENSKTNRSVTLTKYNSNKAIKLKGAIFELRKETTTPDTFEIVLGIAVEKLTTDANGEISLKDLPVGKYQLIETKAPAGYRLDKTPVQFEIIEKQDKTLFVEKTNIKIPSNPGEPTDPGTPPGNGNEKPDPNPEDPNKPGKPTDPGTPPGNGNEKPDPNPEDPNKPGEPTDPGTPPGNGNETPNPEDPNNPGEPTEPGTPPTNPGEPTEPGTPPTNPGEPTNPGTPPTKPGMPNIPPSLPGLGPILEGIPDLTILPTPGNPLTAGDIARIVEKYSKNPAELDAFVKGLKMLLDEYESLSPEQKAEFELLYDVKGLKMLLEELEKVAGLQMKLPQTDGASQFGMMLVGSALLLAGAWLFVTRRRKA